MFEVRGVEVAVTDGSWILAGEIQMFHVRTDRLERGRGVGRIIVGMRRVIEDERKEGTPSLALIQKPDKAAGNLFVSVGCGDARHLHREFPTNFGKGSAVEFRAVERRAAPDPELIAMFFQ